VFISNNHTLLHTGSINKQHHKITLHILQETRPDITALIPNIDRIMCSCKHIHGCTVNARMLAASPASADIIVKVKNASYGTFLY